MVYITTAKRIKQSEKPISTFHKKIQVFLWGVGAPHWGIVEDSSICVHCSDLRRHSLVSHLQKDSSLGLADEKL